MSIFDRIKQEDIILAFFPCVRFEDQILLGFRGESYMQKKWSLRQKMVYDMELMEETKRNYDIVNMLFIICIDRGLRVIFENPFSEQHFLRRYWCMKPSIIDKDRRESGDYFKKPTQYWFLNCEPQGRVLFEAEDWNVIDCTSAIKKITKEHYKDFANTRKEARSMIHPSYARKFIRTQILEEET